MHAHPWVCVVFVCICNSNNNINKAAVLLCQPASVSHPAISGDSEAQPAALLCWNTVMAHCRTAANRLGAESSRRLNHPNNPPTPPPHTHLHPHYLAATL